jgi:hypothetical protein
VALSLGVVGLAAVPAGAQAFGPSGCCLYADNANHTYYPWSLTAGTLSSLRFAMGFRLDSTDMTTDEFQSQDANTDVVAVDVAYGTDASHSWWGLWTCDTLVSGSSTQCNKGTMRFNLSWGTPTAVLACHEVGHSVGLDHSLETSSCMVQPTSPTADDFSTHDRSHINGYY